MEPEAFGYCWHRSNGEFYYGVHKGCIDDGYVGSGSVFKLKFKGSDKSEWNRTIEFRGSEDECYEWETEVVTECIIETPLCLNKAVGGFNSVKYISKEARKRAGVKPEGFIVWNKGKSLSEEHRRKLREARKLQTEPPIAFHFEITSKDGSSEVIFNLREYCRDNDLNYKCMREVVGGRNKQHKGFTARRVLPSP